MVSITGSKPVDPSSILGRVFIVLRDTPLRLYLSDLVVWCNGSTGSSRVPSPSSILGTALSPLLYRFHGVVGSMFACHANDGGSIPSGIFIVLRNTNVLLGIGPIV